MKPLKQKSIISKRTSLAILAGKTAGFLSRKLRVGGGTSLPGAVALKIDRELIGQLVANLPYRGIVITATNGKTTTANMTATVLSCLGLTPVHNAAGANLPYGVATALLTTPPAKNQIGLFEVDEAAAPRIVQETKPKILVVGNIFRDQLDRFGELDKTAALIGQAVKALPEGSYLLLNADDPRVAALARLNQKVKPLFFGLNLKSQLLLQKPQAKAKTALDSSNCPFCQTALSYKQTYFSHLGDYVCSRCGFKRPQLAFAATDLYLTANDSSFNLVTPVGKRKVKLQLPALFNIYNALAAAGVGVILGGDLTAIGQSLNSFQAAFGRLETVKTKGREVTLMLIKNPTGFNQVIETLNLSPEAKNLVIAINDNLADGTDISWLWDADVHLLGRQSVIINSGLRAEDMALRLKYGEVKAEQMLTVNSLDKAVAKALQITQNGAKIYILATYTAMLDVRKYLQKVAGVKAFWQ